MRSYTAGKFPILITINSPEPMVILVNFRFTRPETAQIQGNF